MFCGVLFQHGYHVKPSGFGVGVQEFISPGYILLIIIGLFSLRQLQGMNSIIMLHVMLSELRLWDTCVCHVMTESCNPCQFLNCVAHSRCWTQTYSDTPTSWLTNFLQGYGYMTPWPLPQKFINSESIQYVQNCTFSFTMQLEDVNVEGESYENQPIHGLPNTFLTLNIWNYVNAYFHLDYLFHNKI